MHKKSASSTRKVVVLPPHANAETHKKLEERWAKMTNEELFQTMIDAGIYQPEGGLTPLYAPEDESRQPVKKHSAAAPKKVKTPNQEPSPRKPAPAVPAK